MDPKALEMLQQLSTKMGVAVDVLWEALLRQAFVSAMTGSLLIGGGLATLVCLTWALYANWEGVIVPNDMEGLMVGLICGWILWVLVVQFVTTNLITGFCNPEYWALQKILGLIK